MYREKKGGRREEGREFVEGEGDENKGKEVKCMRDKGEIAGL